MCCAFFGLFYRARVQASDQFHEEPFCSIKLVLGLHISHRLHCKAAVPSLTFQVLARVSQIRSGCQLICGLCVSSSGLHVCCLEWMDHPNVPVPRSPPALLELSHCQVISLSLLVLRRSSIRISFLIFSPDTQGFTLQPLTV